MKRFTPYEGNEPYIFISYSRADSEIMLNTMNLLRDEDYRLWYDEGIPAGDDWPKYISDHLNNSSLVVFFLSAASMVSPNCYSELVAANSQGKRVIGVVLDDGAAIVRNAVKEKRKLSIEEESAISEKTALLVLKRKSKAKIPLAGDWVDALENVTFIDGNCDEHTLAESIDSLDVVGNCLKGDYQDKVQVNKSFNGWIAAIVAGFVLLGFLIYTGYSAYNNLQNQQDIQIALPTSTPKPTIEPGSIPGLTDEVTLPDNKLGAAVRDVLNKGSDDTVTGTELANISYLGLCGKSVISQDTHLSWDDGNWYLGEKEGSKVKVAQGNVSDISVIAQMYYLTELTLVNQNIDSINKLKNLKILTKLDISGNPITSVNLKDGFSRLESLNVSHTNITDFRNINAPETLKKVYVSLDMLPNIKLDTDAKYEVILTK